MNHLLPCYTAREYVKECAVIKYSSVMGEIIFNLINERMIKKIKIKIQAIILCKGKNSLTKS